MLRSSRRQCVTFEFATRAGFSERLSPPRRQERQERHVVRGYVRKATDMSQDEDEKGNQTIRETERFEVQIKTLSRDGEIRVLSGARCSVI